MPSRQSRGQRAMQFNENTFFAHAGAAKVPTVPHPASGSAAAAFASRIGASPVLKATSSPHTPCSYDRAVRDSIVRSGATARDTPEIASLLARSVDASRVVVRANTTCAVSITTAHRANATLRSLLRALRDLRVPEVCPNTGSGGSAGTQTTTLEIDCFRDLC